MTEVDDDGADDDNIVLQVAAVGRYELWLSVNTQQLSVHVWSE